MSEDNRADRFKEEIEEMQLKTTSTGSDRVFQIVGGLAMVAAIVVGFILWSSSTGTANALDQNELVILSATMVSLAILGATLFIVGAMRQFLRFWMLRMLYEKQN